MTDDKSSPTTAPAEAPVSSSGSRFGGHLLDRAKTAKEQAQSQVTGLAQRAGEAAAIRADDFKGQVAHKASDLRDAGLAKLSETLDEFNAALPVIREAGYTLNGVNIGIGLPPKISASFVVSAEVSAETMERLFAEHADRKFTLLLLKSLHQAWQIHTRIHIAGLRPKGLAVELGLIPAVSVQFG